MFVVTNILQNITILCKIAMSSSCYIASQENTLSNQVPQVSRKLNARKVHASIHTLVLDSHMSLSICTTFVGFHLLKHLRR